MSRRGVWLDRALSLITVLAGLAAVYVVGTERVIPALRGEPRVAVLGERLPAALELELLGKAGVGERSGGRIEVPSDRATLLLLFSRTCPACYANLPAWRQVVAPAESVASVLAVALERDRSSALAYARRHLPSARAAVPRDARRLTGTLGIGIVPATALIDAEGVLLYLRQGSLDAAAVDTLVEALAAVKGPQG